MVEVVIAPEELIAVAVAVAVFIEDMEESALTTVKLVASAIETVESALMVIMVPSAIVIIVVPSAFYKHVEASALVTKSPSAVIAAEALAIAEAEAIYAYNFANKAAAASAPDYGIAASRSASILAAKAAKAAGLVALRADATA